MAKKLNRKLLMTADTVGGVWTYSVELAGALAEYDVEVFLATMGAPLSNSQREEIAELSNVKIFESTFRLEWMDEPWADVKGAGEWLLEVESEVLPDLVHLNGYAHAALPWHAPTLVVGHSCVYSWFEAVRGEKPTGEWQRYYTEVQRGLRRASMVTAPTETMLDLLERHYGSFRRVPAIRNGRRSDLFMPRLKEPFIFTAGRLWDEAKNVRLLDRVAPELSWPIVLAGDQVHPDTGEAVFGLRSVGKIDRHLLATYVGRASIFAAPARYEPFGLAVLEAALAGCALVLGDIPSLREVWGDAALYVDPGNADALKNALEYLIDDPLQRERYGRIARRRALTYTPQRMARSYRTLYEALATESHRPNVSRSLFAVPH